MADKKVVRLCIGCGQSDDHPRHVIVGGQPWHMDCHVLATDCEVCAEQLVKCGTSAASDGIIGDELRERLVALQSTVKEH